MTAVKTLRLASDLGVSLDFATEGVGVVGMRGSGKTNLEVLWCERLYKARIPFVVVDPKGDWGGIRSSADGKSPGLPIPVFGGLYGDFPLDETIGRRIADLLVDENMSAILDVSRLSIGARARFLTDFFEQLIDRHQCEPHVRCVILEEAHRYIPQVVPGPLARVKEAAAAILLEGRAWGLGCWAATQRPARLNKDVMEEVGTIVVFRIGVAATNDKRTVTGWFKDENIPGFGPSITKLGNGEGWIHAPNTLGIIQRVQFDRRTTFDSAATPLVGKSGRRVATMADIDTAAIKEALTDSIERAEKNDPTELKKELAKVLAELATRPTASERNELLWWRQFATKFAADQLPAIGSPFTGLGPLYLAGAPVAPEPVPFIPVEVLDARDHVLELASGLVVGIQGMSTVIDGAVKDLKTRPKPALRSVPPLPRGGHASSARTVEEMSPPPARQVTNAPVGEIPAGERKLMVGIAQRGNATVRQLVLLSGLKTSSVKTYLARSSRRGLIAAEGDRYVLTEQGREIVGDAPPLPTGKSLRDYWINDVPEGEGRILAILVERYPESVTPYELIALTDYQASSVKTYVGRLKARDLVDIENGNPKAAEMLFDG